MNDDVIAALRQDLARLESKMDEVLTLRRTLESLVDLIPNPIVRKVVKMKIKAE